MKLFFLYKKERSKFEIINPYTIPNTNVLKNKLGITDHKELDEAESESIITASKLIDVESVKGDFDYQHLMDIHKYIFCNLYEWAGEARTINIEKGEKVLAGMSVSYGHHSNIPKEASKAMLKRCNHFLKLSSSYRKYILLGKEIQER
ncbi:hypothetical protein [Massilibacterium senegalense]|uniref:hypothetical protein n=1 Tax=Massilibacterium senegalense TaxID=1632858 RepID=UPI001C9C8C22|nr:hypothetical protein [Massilibacterium senegalense]